MFCTNQYAAGFLWVACGEENLLKRGLFSWRKYVGLEKAMATCAYQMDGYK